MRAATVVVPTWNGAERLARLLRSLGTQTAPHEVIVVDNGSTDGTRSLLPADFPHVEVVRLEANVGYGRAVNLGAERAAGDALVLLNDDCVVAPSFVASLVGALDPARRVVMAAAVLLGRDDPETIESAGMELDSTLLVWEHLHGEHVSVLERGVAGPVGPSAAAAAFDRDAFRDAGGFDERLFAYWEDVDLVLRLRLEGATCALAADARGTHEHSAALGAGSPAKNYLMGFGRAYVARKWGVVAPRRLPALLARDVPLCLGQILLDRNATGIRGRLDGFRAAADVPRFPYPERATTAGGPGAAATLRRRLRRRARRGRRPHGPVKDLEGSRR